MSYQVIARKWRPQKFDELVGQNHISQTLSNALQNGRLPHALLFTGPRGTGKTTSARILAKSLRCQNAVAFVPCGKCDSCLEIAAGRSTDVLEIDGASNNGVDSIRDLREGVAFMPSSGKYKIYIIDEVHMLSTSAFNALLKTLEEPPDHVIFMMATTEVQKIPQTILSRCQRFDFRRISTRVIVDRMNLICRAENIAADEESLWVIARQGDGSMRDALSLLDQVITFSNGPLVKDSVVEILGLTDRSLLIESLSSLTEKNSQGILKILEQLSKSGTEPGLFASDLLDLIRSTLLIRVAGEKTPEMLDLPDSELRFLRDLGQSVTEEDLHLLFDMMLKGASDLQRSSEPRLVLEMTLLRMASAPRIVDIKTLFSQASLPAANPIVSSPKSAATPIMAATRSPVTSAPPVVHHIALSPSEKWFEFIQKIRSQEPLLAAKVEQLLFLSENNKTLELAVPPKMSFLGGQLVDADVQKKLQNLVEAHFGPGYAFKISSEAQGPETAVSASKHAENKEKLKEEDLRKKVAEHPRVQSATSAFKGSFKIKSTNPQD